MTPSPFAFSTLHHALSSPVLEWEWARPLLLTGLVLLIPWAYWEWRGQRPKLHLARTAVLIALTRSRPAFMVWIVRFFKVGAAVSLAVAMSGPRALGKPNPLDSRGIDIVVALDISTSMRAADFKPKDRLSVAKSVLENHILTRKNDRIGLVVFAGEAFTQLPLTHDRDLYRDVLRALKMGVLADGTAIGDALATGVNRLRESKSASRVLILITDGDNNAGEISPLDAADLAQNFDIQIFPILVGKGGKVPYPTGPGLFGGGFRYVEIPTDPSLLQEIAKRSGGEFFSAQDPAALVASLQQILEKMDKSLLEGSPIVRERIELYPAFAWLAFFFLILLLAIENTRGARIP